MLQKTSNNSNSISSDQVIEAGNKFAMQTHWDLRNQRNIAVIFAFVSLLIAAIAIWTVGQLAPLKTERAVIIEVDKSTGYMEVKQDLRTTSLTGDEIVTKYNIAKYLQSREGYLNQTAQEDYERTILMSDMDALSEFKELWARSNPNNPSLVYKDKTQVDITIKSIVLLNKNTATIRFERKERTRTKLKTTHWQATLGFKYVNTPTKFSHRMENPLGFKVTSYRIDQELVDAK